MTTTPFLPERDDLWLSGRAFRTLLTEGGWNMAACIASLEDDRVRAIMNRDSEANNQAAHYFRCGRQHAADLARSVLYCRGLLPELVFPPMVMPAPVTGPHLPPGARINADGRMTYCTDPSHRDGEHSAACTPPADPANPELRLLRAIFGLCGLCDRTEEHEHEEDRQ